MKKNVLALGAAALLLVSCASKPHYGCRSGRCIVETGKTMPSAKANS